jgi:CheY-like chemotaxis protein
MKLVCRVAHLAAFCYSRKAIRKRPYASSRSVRRIFVVDDEHVIASTLAAILKMNGFSAWFLHLPLEALTAARSQAPDLLISDVVMLDISGIELAIRMMMRFPLAKSCSSGIDGHRRSARRYPGPGSSIRFVLKPVPTTELLFEVGRMVNSIVAICAG